MQQGQVQEEATIVSFYGIPGAPGVGINPPVVEHVKQFIHGISQGSRCLKKGSLILYNCEVYHVYIFLTMNDLIVCITC